MNVLLGKIDDTQTEENQKNNIRDFLLRTFYEGTNEVNVKKKQDLVIHLGAASDSKVGVIVETKRAANKAEMMTVDKPNVKALHELVLYFMRERVDAKNDDIKYLIATNVNEWFIFKAADFNDLFYNDRNFLKSYEDWRDKNKVSGDTAHFYNQIAKPFVENLDQSLLCTHFKLKDYQAASDAELIALYKIFSPYHLLKKPFEQDSNRLDKNFYTELLHIIGLEETKEKNKTLIKRKAKPDGGSLLEKAMAKIESKFSRFDQKKMLEFGATRDERIYNIALELCIVWTNRVLFLKLLESQLIAYHEDKDAYSFLNTATINNFGELYNLFHEVLNKTLAKRDAHFAAKYARIPYLNSSLFDSADVELLTISVDELDNNINLSLPNSSILRKIGETEKDLPTLEYLFRFLDAYDFASEGKDDVQKENRSLINASVLGKVFEKINGYKDGSIYTPGFITMYMCRQAIRLAVVQAFKDKTDFDSDSFSDLTAYTERHYKADDITRFNQIINDLKLCDPAVGSGHFLVSALNEILAIKSELGIFANRAGKPFSQYKIAVANNEIIVTDRDNRPFRYTMRDGRPLTDEMQNLQRALFHEKQLLIENCLFGVDINPNSVKICRLRLWIELLKNAYYKPDDYTELETLPNIDINIKQGNSLLSRFALDEDLREVLEQVEYSIEDYQNFVQGYKETRDRNAKRNFEEKIKQIKDDLEVELNHFSPERIKLADLENQLKLAKGTQFLFGEDEDKRKKRLKKIEKLEKDIPKQEKIVRDAEQNIIYKNAFEWRFEFPEILDKTTGEFLGFDAVIGNPPYGVSIKGDLREKVIERHGKVPDYEIYYFFTNLSREIIKLKGIKSYIIPNTILFNVFAKEYRTNLFNDWEIKEILDCTDFDIFIGSATVRNIITFFIKRNFGSKADVVNYRPTYNATSFEELVSRKLLQTDKETLLANNQNWALIFKLSEEVLELTSKIRNDKKFLSDYFPEFSQGLIAYDKYQGQDEHIIKTRAFHSSEKKKGYKPWLWGEDITRYSVKWNEREFINYCDEVANPREPKYFKGERILIREITNPSVFAGFTSDELYNDPAIINVIKPKREIISIKVLLGILNSKLATFYHFNSSPKATKGAFPKILVDDIKNFPIPEISPEAQEPFVRLVDEILELKKRGADTDAQERAIDRMVYELYDLTKAEIDIVEGAA